ncbi:unnamed protein product, partial [Rotaria sp. Silwood1]
MDDDDDDDDDGKQLSHYRLLQQWRL